MFTDEQWDALQGDVPGFAWSLMRRELLEPILVDLLERVDDEAADTNDVGEYGFHLSPFLRSDMYRDPTAELTIAGEVAAVQYSQLIPETEPQRRWIVHPSSW